MNVLKITEVLAESDSSWEDATNAALKKANESLHGVRSIYIQEFEAKVEDGKIVKYRVNAKISFALD
jgi:flavin-binding protein dodecin